MLVPDLEELTRAASVYADIHEGLTRFGITPAELSAGIKAVALLQIEGSYAR